MMKIKLNYLLLVILIFVCAKLYGRTKNMLWEITSFGENKVYILGSIHAVPDDFYPYPEIIDKKYKECRKIAVETNTIDSLSILQKYISENAYATKDTITNNISEKDLRILKDFLKENNRNYTEFSTFKPWFLTIMINNLKTENQGFLTSNGLDNYFIKKAKSDRKEILCLENLIKTIRFYSEQPDSLQFEILKNTIEDTIDYKTQLKDILTGWETGNTNILKSAVMDDFQSGKLPAHFYKYLILERNNKISQKIEEYLKTGENIFVIVGVGHLVGKDSILQILRRKGYFIKRM